MKTQSEPSTVFEFAELPKSVVEIGLKNIQSPIPGYATALIFHDADYHLLIVYVEVQKVDFNLLMIEAGRNCVLKQIHNYLLDPRGVKKK